MRGKNLPIITTKKNETLTKGKSLYHLNTEFCNNAFNRVIVSDISDD